MVEGTPPPPDARPARRGVTEHVARATNRVKGLVLLAARHIPGLSRGRQNLQETSAQETHAISEHIAQDEPRIELSAAERRRLAETIDVRSTLSEGVTDEVQRDALDRLNTACKEVLGSEVLPTMTQVEQGLLEYVAEHGGEIAEPHGDILYEVLLLKAGIDIRNLAVTHLSAWEVAEIRYGDSRKEAQKRMATDASTETQGSDTAPAPEIPDKLGGRTFPGNTAVMMERSDEAKAFMHSAEGQQYLKRIGEALNLSDEQLSILADYAVVPGRVEVGVIPYVEVNGVPELAFLQPKNEDAPDTQAQPEDDGITRFPFSYPMADMGMRGDWGGDLLTRGADPLYAGYRFFPTHYQVGQGIADIMLPEGFRDHDSAMALNTAMHAHVELAANWEGYTKPQYKQSDTAN